MRYKLLTTLIASTVLFWGPSIGSSGVTDAVPAGVQVHKAIFGWHTDDAVEAKLLVDLNTAVFEFTADDSKSLLASASR